MLASCELHELVAERKHGQKLDYCAHHQSWLASGPSLAISLRTKASVFATVSMFLTKKNFSVRIYCTIARKPVKIHGILTHAPAKAHVK